jgi:hypothetical protein
MAGAPTVEISDAVMPGAPSIWMAVASGGANRETG